MTHLMMYYVTSIPWYVRFGRLMTYNKDRGMYYLNFPLQGFRTFTFDSLNVDLSLQEVPRC